MRTMKDSGLEWIGDIPREWETRQIKYALENHSGGAWGANKGESERDCICVRVADFDYSHLSVNYSEVMTVRSYQQKTICDSALKSGDILLEKSGGGEITPVGRSVLFSSEREMMCANFIEWLRPNFSIQPQFLNYWLSAAYSNGYSKRNVKQTTGIQNLDIPAFLSEKVLVPSGEEQQRISHYLDTKCAEIDALIAAKEKTNTLLKEQRQSIIYEAVTKGLDPTVPMKDSGVEWIGEIPEGWSVRRLKNLASFQTGSTPSTSNPEYFEGNINWFTPGDFNDSFYLTKSERTLSQATIDTGVISLFEKDSILLVAIGATVGKIGLLRMPAYSNQQITAISLYEKTRAEYYAYWLQAAAPSIKATANYTTLPIINNAHLGETLCPFVDDKLTQAEIAAYLREQCAQIDSLITKNSDGIRKLKEYRQSLIYEAVTGKIEI